jgi:hypothetical protein
VDESKDSRGGTDAERNGEDGGKGKSRRSAQLPQCMFKVSQHDTISPGAGVARKVPPEIDAVSAPYGYGIICLKTNTSE